jgi:hypothetical protein
MQSVGTSEAPLYNGNGLPHAMLQHIEIPVSHLYQLVIGLGKVEVDM